VTFSNGATLNVLPGATLRFPNNASLVGYGKIQATGTGSGQTQKIIFTASGSSWSGITISGSGANNSTMDWCFVDKVQTYGGTAVTVNGASGFVLKHSTISNNVNYGTDGVGVFSAGSPEIAYNTINSNGGSGVYFWNTNGYIYKNTIQNNSYCGVECGYYSSPLFGKPGFLAYNGNNKITGGSWGVSASGYSYPAMGTQAPITYYGWNSVYGNSSGRATGPIYAENTWWGSASPNPSWFQGGVDWQPYLTYDPNSQASIKEIPIPQASLVSEGGIDPKEIGLSDAIEARILGDFKKASTLLVEMLDKTDDENTLAFIAAEALNLYRETRDGVVLSKISSKSSEFDQYPSLRLVVAKMHMLDLDPRGGVNSLRSVEAAFPGTEYEKGSMMELFLYYNAQPAEFTEEQGLIGKLLATYPDDNEVKQARWLFGVKYPSKASFEESNTALVDPKTDILEITNFPNPFNPNTTIRFNLPEPGHANLKVYDMLGRVVAELFNKTMTAGRHQTTFNASKLPSGVYFYRLDFGGKSISKKFVLTK